MDLEVRHLRLVQAVAREGTMTRAASALRLTQPALSHQLADLERRLRASLFRRTPRGMILTDAGGQLLNSAERVLKELGEVWRQFDGGVETHAALRLATACYTCYHWLPSRIRRFHSRFPNVDVQVVVEATREPIEALLQNKIDLAVISEDPRRKQVRIKPLFEDEMVAIMSPDHKLAAKPWLNPRDFAAETLITYSVPPSQLTIFQEVLDPAGVSPARVCPVELTEAIVEMVKANLGIAVLARWAVAPHFSHTRPGNAPLKAVRVSRSGLRRTWYAATLQSRIEPPYVNEFVRLVAGDGSPFS